MVVSRGMICSNFTYLPLDSVVRRAGDQVLVNLPKLVIGREAVGQVAGEDRP